MSPNARKSIPTTRLCHSGGHAEAGRCFREAEHLITAPSHDDEKSNFFASGFVKDDIKRLVIRTRQTMAIQVDAGRGLRVTYVWVTFVRQIVGYPVLAGKPPGVPVFGQCSFYSCRFFTHGAAWSRTTLCFLAPALAPAPSLFFHEAHNTTRGSPC